MDTSSAEESEARIQSYPDSDPTLKHNFKMDEDNRWSTPVSPVEDLEDISADQEEVHLTKQLTLLRSYTNSVPYACETPEEMNEKLAQIVDMIYISAKANQLDLLREWDGVLSTWLLMKYPIAKAIRLKLLQYYYQLCVVPVDSFLLDERVKTFSALLPHKHDSVASIDSADLVLDWRRLWRVLIKELWPMRRLMDPSHNVANIYLHLAELSRRFFPGDEVINILRTILPLLSPETFLSVIPVLTSFIPLSHAEEYLPALFSIWEAFNSNIVDERMIELMAELAEEHVPGSAGPFGKDGSVSWKDVGIWTEKQWILITGKCLGAMNVPVGGAKGASTTGGAADMMGMKNSLRIKKPINKNNALAKLFVYSMSVDGPIRTDEGKGQIQSGFLAGSRALDSLEKFITSAETFFHPSNTGVWTLNLSNFLQRLAFEFCKRWKEEEDPKCKTPLTQRLTTEMRHAFVLTLRTPTLLALFAKDRVALGLAQGASRCIALLEPGLVMPQLLERAYSGLEVVNETHRTTAVLSMLTGITLPLVSERIWCGGQKHLVPLLELCLPAIDLNDPSKTICATLFICSALQHIKIGDLSMHTQSSGLLTIDGGLAEGTLMDADEKSNVIPDGAEGLFPILSREEERVLARDSTAGFADWVASLFRRVFALYENLPEEGGRRNTTGGKSEESVLKSIKNMLDVVCLHLSDALFDLVLNIVYDYATTNAKPNAVRAIGQLVACLARSKPLLTIDRFLPFCSSQVKEELKHGASSIRTTSSHAAVSSDTSLHWNLSLLRGCLGYGGPALLKHKDTILELLSVLIDQTKSERGFSGAGRVVSRVLLTLSGTYPINGRLVNTDEWESEDFNKNHNLRWGRFYDVKDVKIEWHLPSDEEIAFVLQILDEIVAPLLGRIKGLLANTGSWDNISTNDFCRYMYAVRSVWSGLPTLFETRSDSGDPCFKDKEHTTSLQRSGFLLKAGFALTNSQDPRYQAAVAHRERFGRIVHHAAGALRGNLGGEDHIDAVIAILKSIDTYLLEYGTSRSVYASLQKNYVLARNINRMWPRQRENTRLVLLKRAQVYHNARLATHSINRFQTQFDVLLFDDLIEYSVSPYTRVRRHSQCVLFGATDSYPLSALSVLPKMISTLARGSDPDRMKGALYVLSYKNYRPVVRYHRGVFSDLITALLECQHQEKPSVQKLVASVHTETLLHCGTEGSQFNYVTSTEGSGPTSALEALRDVFPGRPLNEHLLSISMSAAARKSTQNEEAYEKLTASILEIARRPMTHWRYLQMAVQSIPQRRSSPPLPDVAKILMETTTSSHPSTRIIAQRSVVKLLAYMKIRSYSKNDEELLFDEWRNPLQQDLPVTNTQEVITFLQRPFSGTDFDPPVYVDKVSSGFLSWAPTLKAYSPPDESFTLSSVWEPQSRPTLDAIELVMQQPAYFSSLLSLWGQETDAGSALNTDIDLRSENMLFIKTIAKTFEKKYLDKLLQEIEPLLLDSDRFKQRAAAEVVGGLLRGSKHWIEASRRVLWSWLMSRIEQVSAQIKPDTTTLWEGFFRHVLADTDPSRNKPLIDWILSMPLEFQNDSAFKMNKTLDLFSTLVHEMGVRFGGQSKRYIDLLFDNAQTGYAEIRMGIAQNLHLLMECEMNPSYPSVDAFLLACKDESDPLMIRSPRYMNHIYKFVESFPHWRLERLPPPRVNQSQFDKVSLTLLSWLWTVGHCSEASILFPYVIPLLPDILKMSELNDNHELTTYSSGVLFVLSAVTPPQEYVEIVINQFITTIRGTTSHRIKQIGLPLLALFFYRNFVSVSEACTAKVMDAIIACLADENLEVREVAKRLLAGLLRCSQRRLILPLRDQFVAAVKDIKLPKRQEPGYADALRQLHSAILGICALIESFPYSVEPWLPPLTEVLAPHASDPQPIATTIRKTASEFKKTHQDTWHIDQHAFNEEQLQDLSSMLIGTSYYA